MPTPTFTGPGTREYIVMATVTTDGKRDMHEFHTRTIRAASDEDAIAIAAHWVASHVQPNYEVTVGIERHDPDGEPRMLRGDAGFHWDYRMDRGAFDGHRKATAARAAEAEARATTHQAL